MRIIRNLLSYKATLPAAAVLSAAKVSLTCGTSRLRI